MLTFTAFERQIDAVFTVKVPEQDVQVQLKLAEAVQSVVNERQEQFSLLFHGPETPFLSQGTYFFEHEHFGQQSLFIVPVGQSQEGYQYEVIISRLLDQSVLESVQPILAEQK